MLKGQLLRKMWQLYISQIFKMHETKTDRTIIILEMFNIPLVTGRKTKQNISKYIEYLGNIINLFDLIDTYRTLHPTSSRYRFVSSTREAFTKIDLIVSN